MCSVVEVAKKLVSAMYFSNKANISLTLPFRSNKSFQGFLLRPVQEWVGKDKDCSLNSGPSYDEVLSFQSACGV